MFSMFWYLNLYSHKYEIFLDPVVINIINNFIIYNYLIVCMIRLIILNY